MKTLIYFNFNDKPENMGISQLTDNVQQFLAERSEILINPVIVGNILEFENPEGLQGYAVMTETPEDFEN